MKTLILLFFPAIFFSQTTYQNGFSEGYRAGYCHGVISGCVSPVAPIGPVDIKNDYQTGYNNGFVAGKQQQQSSNTNSGGAYGQLKPTDSKVGDVYQNMVNNIISNHDNTNIQQAWDNYYLKKEQNLETAKQNNSQLYDILYRQLMPYSKGKKDEILYMKEINKLIEENNKLLKKYNSSSYNIKLKSLEYKIKDLYNKITR